MPEHVRTRPPFVLAPLVDRDEHHKSTVNAPSHTPDTTQRCALLAWNPIKNDDRFVAIRNLSEKQDLREAAANLFRYLRELDAPGVDLIVAERVPDQGLGAAILDRLARASHA